MTTNFTEQQRQILSIVLFEQVGKSSEGEQMDKETLKLYKEIVNQKAKERLKKIAEEDPERLKEINRKAYLKRKEKIEKEKAENI